MKAFAFLSILLLTPAIFAQQQPSGQYSIFDRDRNLVAVGPRGPQTRPDTPAPPFIPIFIGVLKDDTGSYVGVLQNQTDLTDLKIGDTLTFNQLKIIDLDLTRMLLSNRTSIPIGNDLLNRPHYLPTAPLLAAATPTPPATRPSRRGNNPFAAFSSDPNQPNVFGTRGRGNTPGTFGPGNFGPGTTTPPSTAPAPATR